MTASGCALVTAAPSGIDHAIAKRLVTDGWNVLAANLDPDPDGPGKPFVERRAAVDPGRPTSQTLHGADG